MKLPMPVLDQIVLSESIFRSQFINYDIFKFIKHIYNSKLYFDKKEEGLYGLRLKGFNWRPYFTMLLIMLPLIIWASFNC
mgnify:CR=1 FL=1